MGEKEVEMMEETLAHIHRQLIEITFMFLIASTTLLLIYLMIHVTRWSYFLLDDRGKAVIAFSKKKLRSIQINPATIKQMTMQAVQSMRNRMSQPKVKVMKEGISEDDVKELPEVEVIEADPGEAHIEEEIDMMVEKEVPAARHPLNWNKWTLIVIGTLYAIGLLGLILSIMFYVIFFLILIFLVYLILNNPFKTLFKGGFEMFSHLMRLPGLIWKKKTPRR
jgi:ABC-type multidrug transport system fused ATPase/permease subunit